MGIFKMRPAFFKMTAIILNWKFLIWFFFIFELRNLNLSLENIVKLWPDAGSGSSNYSTRLHIKFIVHRLKSAILRQRSIIVTVCHFWSCLVVLSFTYIYFVLLVALVFDKTLWVFFFGFFFQFWYIIPS